ncbi:uncharacterized protein LOC116803641 [Drosophila sechellia]|uniref:uncharacterized protein LOC116803641 n=1 Tax=Drosophila sechellia TaxID=7238 RepID=UPI0013DE6783|nr:uncharacterized protein LOC116803641 [Drosophila sechellia]
MYLNSHFVNQFLFVCFTDRIEYIKMFKILLLAALSMLTYKISSCDENPHLCRQVVTVNYTEKVTRPLEDFGNFAKYFQQLGIPTGKKLVTLTKLEEKEVCCAGFEKSTDEKCVPIQPTTTSTTETIDLTESTESSSPKSDSSGEGNAPSSLTELKNNHKTLILSVVIGSVALIIVLACVIVLRIRQKRRLALGNNCGQVIFNAEMQAALL